MALVGVGLRGEREEKVESPEINSKANPMNFTSSLLLQSPLEVKGL